MSRAQSSFPRGFHALSTPSPANDEVVDSGDLNVKREEVSCRAFLLRVWAGNQGHRVRASIRDVDTGETHAFPDLDDLHKWLNQQTRTRAAQASKAGGHDEDHKTSSG